MFRFRKKHVVAQSWPCCQALHKGPAHAALHHGQIFEGLPFVKLRLVVCSWLPGLRSDAKIPADIV